MKEININIEGYNVNGICVGCLNYNRRMFYHPTVKECFRLLGNIDVSDAFSVISIIKEVQEGLESNYKSYNCVV